jgi:hypothetical protein
MSGPGLRHALASARLQLTPPQPGEDGERTARLVWLAPLELRAEATGEVETLAELGRAARLYAEKLHAVARGLWVVAGRCTYCGGEVGLAEGWPECTACERVPGE